MSQNMVNDLALQKQLKRVTAASVLVALLLILLKAGAWFVGGSVSVLASLVDSATDFFASLLNLFAVRWAMKPADEDHQFGHGKAESLSALAQAGFIGGSAVFLLLNATERFFQPQPIQHAWQSAVVMIISMLLTLLLVLYQRHVLKQVDSQAVKADSLHYAVDFLSNLVVLIAIGFAAWGWEKADSVFASILGFWVLWQAYKLGREAVDTLMDKALPENEIRAVEQAVKSVPGVLGVHDIKTRLSANRYFIQLHVELPDSLNIVEGHQIAVNVVNEVHGLFAGKMVEVLVHQDPVSEYKSILE